ncbi:OmpA family protein [Ruficoccus amylovorans]|uniref:OmpA family protein n=1 Tax=Ruficoccus amylovorans TaxID=1804625 RepID=A0A842HDT6_9BACT|nr:OmpA family protein [Ruficoccus amylovorans]MBC2594389.1 OmpA family protein [Ruficoccus amylovorans]
MKKVSLYLASLSLCAVLFSGCESDPEITPEDTLSSTVGADRPDWINPDAISANSGDSLTMRDARFSDMNGGIAGDDSVMAIVQFGFDEFTVQPSEHGKLNEVVNFMNSNPNSRAICEGHTDWYGTTEYNLGLGDRRARAVMDYLVRQGIAPTRIEVLSLGELEADQDLPKTDSRVIDDRRVEVKVVE